MTVKENAIKTITELPDDAAIDDIMEAIYIRAKVEAGLAEIKDGKGVPHEEAVKRLMKWVK